MLWYTLSAVSGIRANGFGVQLILVVEPVGDVTV